MICPYCSAELPDDAQYCGECGGDVTVTQTQLAKTSHADAHTNITRVSGEIEKQRNAKLGVAVVVGVSAIAVILAIIGLALLF